VTAKTAKSMSWTANHSKGAVQTSASHGRPRDSRLRVSAAARYSIMHISIMKHAVSVQAGAYSHVLFSRRDTYVINNINPKHRVQLPPQKRPQLGGPAEKLAEPSSPQQKREREEE
jgi:hypothetical protein